MYIYIYIYIHRYTHHTSSKNMRHTTPVLERLKKKGPPHQFLVFRE